MFRTVAIHFVNKFHVKRRRKQQLNEENGKNEYNLSEISKHNKANDLWLIIDNGVFDVTKFWEKHPVSPELLLKLGGKDVSTEFRVTPHSIFAKQLLEKMKIGIVSKKDQETILKKRNLESMKLTESEMKLSLKKREKTFKNVSKKEIRIKLISVFPVKGCKGINVKSTIIEQNGLLNDRIYCIIDTETNSAINQIKYPKLSLIQPKLENIEITENHKQIELFYYENDNKNKIIVPTINDKNKILSVQFSKSSTPILCYDQGENVNKWITNFINKNHNNLSPNKKFKFCKILRENERVHEDYFSLPFIKKSFQPIKGVLNYSAVNIASQESMNKLNSKISKHSKKFSWDRWRVNIVIQGLGMPHFEDYIKYLDINNNVKLLWNRRRYLCSVPNVIQETGEQTCEPQNTLTNYRNANVLQDDTSVVGIDAVYFGSFFLVKQSGKININDIISVQQIQINEEQNNSKTSRDNPKYYGLYDDDKYFNIKCKEYQECILIKKDKLNHDTFKFRFKFKNNQNCKLNIGGHYLLKFDEYKQHKIGKRRLSFMEPCIRAYTPVDFDNDDDNTYFDLVIKIYKNGRMSQHLNNMKIGDYILAKQHYNDKKIKYIKYGDINKFIFGNPTYSMKDNVYYELNINQINMICGGTGITPIFKVIKHLFNAQNNIKIRLFYSNKTINDILLFNQLNEMSTNNNNNNIEINYFITNQKEEKHDDISFNFERMNKEIIQNKGFKPNENCISLLCGSTKMNQIIQNYLKEIGFDDKYIYIF